MSVTHQIRIEGRRRSEAECLGYPVREYRACEKQDQSHVGTEEKENDVGCGGGKEVSSKSDLTCPENETHFGSFGQL